MTTKINLTDLTDSDYKALLQNNKVWNKLIEFASENAAEMVSSWFSSLDGVSDYSLSDSSQYNYIRISNSYNFLSSILDVQKDYVLLDGVMAAKIEKLLSDYESANLDTSFENEIDEVGGQVTDELVKYATNEYNRAIENTSLLEAMKDNEALEFIYSNNAYYNREDNKIYYVCAD